MKLRIRGNSLRLRVSRPELARITEQGFVEDAISFSPGTRLRYRIEVQPEGPISADLEGTQLTVVLPKAAVARWAAPQEVSLRAEQRIAEGETLKILVEKDFECIGATEEDQSDLFPNPLSSEDRKP